MELPLGQATRDAYGKALLELGRENSKIVVLDADLSKSTKTSLFAHEFPNRFFNMGIAEANMVSVASGLAASGKIPFASSFACFVICKAFDQLRISVALPRMNVKIVASHGGISVGEDGPSQQSVEDIALACSLPGFVVIVPADAHSTTQLVRKIAEYLGPVYMRVGRPKAPVIYPPTETFTIGRGKIILHGEDATVMANGLLVAEALKAAEALHEKGVRIRVVDMHTVKPIDEEVIVSSARVTGAIVTAEEHLLSGGLGSAVAQVAGRSCPVPMEFVGIADTYAESGNPQELMEKYGLTARHIEKAVERVLSKKRKA